MMHHQAKAYVFAGLTILFWSTVATAFKIALGYMDFPVLLLYSSITSLVVLFIVGSFSQGTAGLFRQSRQNYRHSALLGFFNPFLYYLILFKAYSLLPAQVAQPLNMVWPVVLSFLSVPFLKNTITPRSYLALFICFGGAFLIATRGNLSGFHIQDPAGVILALGSSIIWSFFWLFNVKDSRPEESKLFLNFLFASLYIVLFTAFTGRLVWPGWKGFLAAVYIGIFEMGITFVFWLKALRYSRSPDQISTLMYLFPFLSLVLIHFVLGESIFYTTFIGLVLIVTGIFVQKYPIRKKS